MNYSFVKDTEMLTRFVFTPQHIDKRDGSIKWQAFKPASDGTSVTRQDYVSPEKILQLGVEIAKARKHSTKLHSKAEILAQNARKLKIDVTAAPTARDPNHANIVKWPSDKNEVMMLCKELLIASRHVLSYLP
ncbi:MAG: hypothetical protein ABH836_08355 [Candidatus Omnitrophota bacterium]